MSRRLARGLASLSILLVAGLPEVRAQRPTLPAGTVRSATLEDSVFHRPRRVWVYTPPGYDPRRAGGYDLVVAFDGGEYQDSIPLPRVLDSLLAGGRAPSFVALLIDDSSSAVRTAELGNSARFAHLLGSQLIPWLRHGYAVTRDPHRVIITGSSAGGLAAAHAAFMRPDLFGNVLSQSGAFWRSVEGSSAPPYEWLTDQYRASPKKDIRFVLDVGALETHATLGGSGPVFIDANRRFRDVLRAKGYELTYTEVAGGIHAPSSWRNRLGDGIVALTAGWPRGR